MKERSKKENEQSTYENMYYVLEEQNGPATT
jgi:hypothetical protein